MKLKEALNVVDKCTGAFNGTRQDHFVIQEAMNVIKQELEKKEKKPEKRPKVKMSDLKLDHTQKI